MPEVSAVAGRVGFVASPGSWAGELPTSAEHCARTGQTLVISSKDAARHARELTGTYPSLDARIDSRFWASCVASDDVLTGNQTLFDLDTWVALEAEAWHATSVFTPSAFISAGAFDRLAAQLQVTGPVGDPRLITLVATDAAMLGAKHRTRFFEVLQASTPRRLAFVFADKKSPMSSYDRLQGQRELVETFPDALIVATDVPAGTDALAHGAAWVGIGASSSRRMERRPGDTGRARWSADYLPGTWMRELMEMRSPSVYADWYANERTPVCRRCNRGLESYQPRDGDKAQLIAHNLHGIDDFAAQILAVEQAGRAAWLNDERIAAFERHARLTGKDVDADRTLRMLCELDDPTLRETSPSGRWRS